jgi:hypothetical protein
MSTYRDDLAAAIARADAAERECARLRERLMFADGWHRVNGNTWAKPAPVVSRPEYLPAPPQGERNYGDDVSATQVIVAAIGAVVLGAAWIVYAVLTH